MASSAGTASAGLVISTPTRLNPGDHFRILFITSGTTTATSSVISNYDTFVNTDANGATYNGSVISWKAIVSTPTVNAISLTGQKRLPLTEHRAYGQADWLTHPTSTWTGHHQVPKSGQAPTQMDPETVLMLWAVVIPTTSLLATARSQLVIGLPTTMLPLPAPSIFTGLVVTSSCLAQPQSPNHRPPYWQHSVPWPA